ncbi:MAG: diaminopimelate decarboxylase [Actinobacteria bacterium]|nr:diaminopimelate decarboxylase [Actinomycetota bacterium]
MAWEVLYTDQFEDWWNVLTESDQEHLAAYVEMLTEFGPDLGRPAVDRIKTSRHHNMKELRPTKSMRVLFAFDPSRDAVLLIGGDKAGNWTEWYVDAIPIADDLYDQHLKETDQAN